MDILDRVDISKVPTFGNKKAGVDKVEKFSWSKSSGSGRYQSIEKYELHIDGEYQRDAVSQKKIMKIAREWDWMLFGCLLIAERKDGTYWVYDGGHRVRASFHRGDIDKLPCMVFDSDCIEDEARAFVGKNTMKSNVTAYQKHIASVSAGEPIAIIIEDIITSNGYHPAPHTRKNGFTAIGKLNNMVKENETISREVFSVCCRISDDGQNISSMVLGALFFLCKSCEINISSGEFFGKLMDSGLLGIERVITREKHMLGMGGDKVSARGVLNILNKGKRRKISLKESK